MADVTSDLLSISTAASFQLTAERFPVGDSATRDNNAEDNDFTKTEVGSSSLEAEYRRLVPSDLSVTNRRSYTNEQRPLVDSACWWPDGPPSERVVDGDTAGGRPIITDDDDDGRLERLAAESAVGRLALMIQRIAADNQRDVPVTHLYQTTPSSVLMTSRARDCARYFCHVCPYVGKSQSQLLTIGTYLATCQFLITR